MIQNVLDIVGIEFLEKYRNTPIYICCSGGIDSTCILTSFLKNSTRSIGVLYNSYSISENRKLFGLLSKNPRITLEQCSLQNIDRLLADGAAIFTGTPADIIVEPYIKPEYDNTGYKDYISSGMVCKEFFVPIKYQNPKCLNDFIINGEYICSYSPVEIRSVKDFWWWIGISTMYNGLNYIWHCTTSDEIYPINFYDHQLFIDYSVYNHINNKKYMIDYNLEYFKDDGAILHYKKQSSKMLDEYEDNLVCINENYKKILMKHNRYEYSVKKLLHYKQLIMNL